MRDSSAGTKLALSQTTWNWSPEPNLNDWSIIDYWKLSIDLYVGDPAPTHRDRQTKKRWKDGCKEGDRDRDLDYKYKFKKKETEDCSLISKLGLSHLHFLSGPTAGEKDGSWHKHPCCQTWRLSSIPMLWEILIPIRWPLTFMHMHKRSQR